MKKFSWVELCKWGFLLAFSISVCVAIVYATGTITYNAGGFGASAGGLILGTSVTSATQAQAGEVTFLDTPPTGELYPPTVRFTHGGLVHADQNYTLGLGSYRGPVELFTGDNVISMNAYDINQCEPGGECNAAIDLMAGCDIAGRLYMNTNGAELTSRNTMTNLTAKDLNDDPVASVSALYSDGDGQIDLVTPNSSLHLDTDGDIALATDNVSLTIAEDALWWNECIYLETPSTFLLDMTGEDGNGGLILASQRAGLGVADSGGTEGTDGEVYIATPKSSIYLDPNGNVVVQLGAPQSPQMGSSGAQTAMVGQGTAVAAGAPAQLQRAQSYLQGTAAAAQTTQAAFDNAAWLRTISTVPPLSDKDLHPEQYYH